MVLSPPFAGRAPSGYPGVDAVTGEGCQCFYNEDWSRTASWGDDHFYQCGGPSELERFDWYDWYADRLRQELDGLTRTAGLSLGPGSPAALAVGETVILMTPPSCPCCNTCCR